SPGVDAVANRVLHKGIRDQDEVTGNPTPDRDCHRGDEMVAGSQSLFAEDERTDKSAFQEESEHPFHGQRLSDHAARILGKPRPVGAELKLHRNSGNNTYGKIESENLCPESNGFIVLFISRAQRTPLP